MRAKEFIIDLSKLNESLNQPYNLIDWYQEDFGEPLKTWAALPDGTNLEINFNKESPLYNDWDVDFYRGGTIKKTGQGDQQRIFATVLSAIQQFINNQQPNEIRFSAIKHEDETGSRQKLYTALAKKYAAGLGYALSTKDDAYHQHYIFKKIKKDVAEGIVWSELDEGLSMEDKMSIFEEFYTKGSLTESVDIDKKEYFVSLFNMSSQLTKGKKYIVVPLSLVGNKIMPLDAPSIAVFVAKSNDGLTFKTKLGKRTYPSKTMRDLSIFNTFTFLSIGEYDKFRTALSLKFDTHLPNIEIEENARQNVAEGKIKLYTEPDYFGAEVDDTGFDRLPVINIPVNKLVGFEPDSKMSQPKSRANVKKIVAGLKKGDRLPPILVRKYKDGYQVLDGHHRFWAYKLLDLKSIPSRIVPDRDIEEIGKQGVVEDIDYQRHLKLINAHMKKMGYQRLGGGRDAQVYAKQQGNIIKILIPQDEKTVRSAEIPFLEFYKYCQANQKNPHLPKFGEIQGQDYADFYIDGERFVQIAQERLLDIPAPSEYDDMLFDMINSVENNTPLEQRYPGYELFYKTLKSVAQRGRALGFENDFIKSDDDFNIMLRGKTLVITDPWLNASFNENVTESMGDDDSKKLKGFHQSLGNAVRGHVSQMQANMAILKAQHPDTWLWEPGDIVYSAKTGRTYEIVGPWLDNRGTAKYLYRGNDEEKGTFVADRAHQTLKKISGKQDVEENFADGRNPGRKGLSRRVGIPKKATLGQLEKIAKSSNGERRRMAQWQLNMRRGRNKKK
jgi:hypothetical protein